MLPTILTILALLLVLFFAYVATRPSDFRIERSLAINAVPTVVFEQVNDLRLWDGWSPWAKMDPHMKQTYSGPAAGVGAVHEWNGNKKVGKGRMTIMQSEPVKRVVIKLEFIKPFTATNASEFTFTPQGSGTLVNWAMTGHNNFMMKLFGVIMNMDKMVGKDFEKGLAAMKSVAEG